MVLSDVVVASVEVEVITVVSGRMLCVVDVNEFTNVASSVPIPR